MKGMSYLGRTVIDYSGKRFGRLVVLKMIRKNKRTYCECVCDCGNIVEVRIDSIKPTGETRSCGCLSKDIKEGNVKVNVKHGMSNSLLYNSWDAMKKRCLNPKSDGFKWYGDRGISICDEWKDDFCAFRDWAFDNGYREGLTIDRIDPNGNYEPSNCRWATIKEQANNKRTNIFIIYKGEKITLTQVAEKTGINTQTILGRYKRGWRCDKLISPAR